jgi:hypothetical protein
MALHQNEGAVQSLEELLKIDPDNNEALFELGALFHRLHRYEESLAALDRIDPDELNSPSYWQIRGSSLLSWPS